VVRQIYEEVALIIRVSGFGFAVFSHLNAIAYRLPRRLVTP